MKLSLTTDFTKLPRAERTAAHSHGEPPAWGRVVLAHDERHLRRRVLTLVSGDKVLVDLVEPVMLGAHDRLLLDDGRQVEVVAADEELHEIRARDAVHLTELAWHLGNRHLAAEIAADRILILRDHVIKAMLDGLGARVTDVVAPFQPVRGAYSGHGGHDHGHDDYSHHDDHHHDHDHHSHDHAHGHEHAHQHGKRDAFGRLPGDPHYGHNHA